MQTRSAIMAQSEDEIWQPPVNISQSGTADQPFYVVDAGGVTYLFWQDTIGGFAYTTNAEGDWRTPQPVSLPFSTPFFTPPTSEFFEAQYVPVLVADDNGAVHAFWSDQANRLYYSRAQTTSLPDVAAWTNPLQLAQSAVGLSVNIDANGVIHLAYFRTEESNDAPPGVYVRRSVNEGGDWSSPVNLYASSYLRTLSAGQAHLRVETGAPDQVYVVWDDPFLEGVFLAQSTDGGETWLEPVVIDQRQPEDAETATGPSQIEVLASNENVHLVWRAQHDQGNCQQFHQWSGDGGVTWQDATAIFEDGAGCLASNRLFAGAEDDLIFLLTRIRNEFYLRAWDEGRWSVQEQQVSLPGFVHPQVFRSVTLNCLQYSVTEDNQLFVFGCGSSLTNDIWALQRPLGDAASWAPLFPDASPWSPPVVIGRPTYQPSWMSLVSDGENNLHVFWSQVEPVRNITETVIYYARFEEDRWSNVTAIVSFPGDGEDMPLVKVDEDANLFYLFWSTGVPSTIYVSRASIPRAATVAEWSAPTPLPASATFSNHLDVAVDRSGALFAAFAVPLNEDRGLYLTKSEDNGETWDAPAQIFDGRSAGWEMVGEPQLILVGDNQLHATVSRYALPGFDSTGFGHLRSLDGGGSWSDLTLVSESPTAWRQMVSTGARVVHQLWQDAENRDVTWHSVSADAGSNWSQPVRFTEFGQTVQQSAVAADNAGRLHLINVIQDIQNRTLLQEWLWDGAAWELGDSLRLQLVNAQSRVSHFDAVYQPSERLAAVYMNGRVSVVGGQQTANYQLLGSFRPLEIPADQVQVPPTLTPTSPMPTPTPTAVPDVTPTPDLQALDLDDANSGSLQIGPLDAGSTAGQMALGILPALLVVLAVFGVGIYTRRVRK